MSAKNSSDTAAAGPVRTVRDAGDVLAGIVELWLSEGPPGPFVRAIAEVALADWWSVTGRKEAEA